MLSAHCRSRLLLALALGALVSCSATVVSTQYQNPAAQRVQFKKLLSLCVAKDPTLREAAEVGLCRHVSRVECKPAAFAIPDSMLTNIDEVKALTKKEGFDGVLAFRVIDAGPQATYMPSTYGPTFWAYYGYVWPRAINPSSYRTDRVVVVETAIFSLAHDDLLWIGTTKTLDPKSLKDLVDEVADAVRGELQSEGLIPAS